MKKYGAFVCFLLMLLLLSSCQPKEESVEERVIDETPPTLFLAVSDVLIKKIEVTSYDWTFTLPNGQTKHIRQMDMLPPSKEVAEMKKVNVKAFRYLKVGFDPMPIYYDVTLYNREDEEVAHYESIEAIKERGSYVVKIDAEFKNGEAIYYVPLHIAK